MPDPETINACLRVGAFWLYSYNCLYRRRFDLESIDGQMMFVSVWAFACVLTGLWSLNTVGITPGRDIALVLELVFGGHSNG